METEVVALLCRTSDRTPGGSRGAAALAPLLGEARIVEGTDPPRTAGWEDDLRDSAACLRTAGNVVEEALAAGRLPVLLAGDCTISIATLPAVVRARPAAKIVWLDAHGDFNAPDTTPSGFLGGMCLAGACGRWATGFEGAVHPDRVVLVGARDLDPPEQAALDEAGATRLDATADVAGAVAGDEVYVHLDLDVLDPSVLPAQFPVDGGLDLAELEALLADIAGAAARVAGVEITCLETPGLAAAVAVAIAPLLP